MENHSTSDIDIDIETSEVPKKGLTRRQVATGAAWAVPVIAIAVAAPGASASVPDPQAWQKNLFSQFSSVVSNLNVGKKGSTVIRANVPTKLVIINNSSTQDVPAGAATITLTLIQTAGATLSADGFVFSSIGQTGVVGLNTHTISWTNNAVIPAGSRTADIPIGYKVPKGTSGVNEATTWTVKVTTVTGSGTYDTGSLDGWSGATTT